MSTRKINESDQDQIIEFCKRKNISIDEFNKSCTWIRGAMLEPIKDSNFICIDKAIKNISKIKSKSFTAKSFMNIHADLTTAQILKQLGFTKMNIRLK